LHDIEGYRHKEIAEIVGRSVGVSKSQLHKARMRLRKLLHEFKRGKARDERKTVAKMRLRPREFCSLAFNPSRRTEMYELR
jgi:transposase